MKILCFAGALRKDSFNKKFAREAQRFATGAGADAEYVDIRDYPMPVYDGDIEAANGIPEGTQKLGEKIRAVQALIISTPEYNGSIPGSLKNIIDWLSREKNMSLGGKHLLLLAASPGALGGVRSLWHTRQPFEVLGVHVFPGMLGLSNAAAAFNDEGHLKDNAMADKLRGLVEQFVKHVTR
jgi:NAD(P)H-dependent FMN reductase